MNIDHRKISSYQNLSRLPTIITVVTDTKMSKFIFLLVQTLELLTQNVSKNPFINFFSPFL